MNAQEKKMYEEKTRTLEKRINVLQKLLDELKAELVQRDLNAPTQLTLVPDQPGRLQATI